MALIIKDRVKETTTTTGTGTITLAGASIGFRSFADIGNTNTTYYCISGGSQFEVGLGTYTLSGTTLARTTVLSNSLGTTALIDFSAGTKDVFCTYPTAYALLGSSQSVTSTGTGSVVLSDSPTFTTGITSPLLIGGSSTTQTSIYKTTSGVGATGSRHIFQVGNNGATEAMTILNNGNVGVGTSAPSNVLEVSSNTNSNLIKLIQTGASNQSNINFSTVGGSGLFQLDQSGNLVFRTLQGSLFFDNTGSTGSIFFRTGGTNVRIRIDSNGNVGINTTNPQGIFDVNGTIRTAGYTVATLPTGTVGMRAYVTDAILPTYLGALTGGGSVHTPVFRNATVWVSA